MTDSTDPDAVTHGEARGAVAGMAEASGWMAVGRKLERYISQQESALTDMTARAEAAEGDANRGWAEVARLGDELLKAARLPGATLGTRLYGGKAMAAEQQGSPKRPDDSDT